MPQNKWNKINSKSRISPSEIKIQYICHAVNEIAQFAHRESQKTPFYQSFLGATELRVPNKMREMKILALMAQPSRQKPCTCHPPWSENKQVNLPKEC